MPDRKKTATLSNSFGAFMHYWGRRLEKPTIQAVDPHMKPLIMCTPAEEEKMLSIKCYTDPEVREKIAQGEECDGLFALIEDVLKYNLVSYNRTIKPMFKKMIKELREQDCGWVKHFESRIKTPESVLYKMVSDNKSIADISDGIGIRIVVDNSEGDKNIRKLAYMLIKMMNGCENPEEEGQMQHIAFSYCKDYLSYPKYKADESGKGRLMYKGVHLIFKDFYGRPFEIQIHSAASQDLNKESHAEYKTDAATAILKKKAETGMTLKELAAFSTFLSRQGDGSGLERSREIVPAEVYITRLKKEFGNMDEVGMITLNHDGTTLYSLASELDNKNIFTPLDEESEIVELGN